MAEMIEILIRCGDNKHDGQNRFNPSDPTQHLRRVIGVALETPELGDEVTLVAHLASERAEWVVSDKGSGLQITKILEEDFLAQNSDRVRLRDAAKRAITRRCAEYKIDTTNLRARILSAPQLEKNHDQSL